MEAGRPALDWTRPRFDSYCADKQTARAVSGIGDATCFMLGKDSSKLNVLNDSFAVSCYLPFDGAQQRPAEDALLSTRRTLADAIVSHRRPGSEPVDAGKSVTLRVWGAIARPSNGTPQASLPPQTVRWPQSIRHRTP